MNVKKVAADQPEFFQFSDKNLNRAKKIIKNSKNMEKFQTLILKLNLIMI